MSVVPAQYRALRSALATESFDAVNIVLNSSHAAEITFVADKVGTFRVGLLPTAANITIIRDIKVIAGPAERAARASWTSSRKT